MNVEMVEKFLKEHNISIEVNLETEPIDFSSRDFPVHDEGRFTIDEMKTIAHSACLGAVHAIQFFNGKKNKQEKAQRKGLENIQ